MGRTQQCRSFRIKKENEKHVYQSISARRLQEAGRIVLSHSAYVAVEGDTIIGFGDIDKTGYLDRLYVHADYQKKGAATAICSRLEQAVSGKITTHASITARPFFEKRGYRVVREQQVERKGVFLTNFVMEKDDR